jgi:Ion channel
MKQDLVRKWSTEHGLSALLAVLVVYIFVLHPIEEMGLAGVFWVEILFALVLVAGVWAVWNRGAHAVIFAATVGIAEVVRWVHWVAPTAGLASWAALSSSVAIGLLMFLVLRHVMLPGPITRHRIRGAIAVYLLIGFMWGHAYDFLQILIPGGFQLPSRGPGPGAHSWTLLYFSFTTLTTLGYGDILPVHPVARSLALVEALMGQLYPAILIGGLVSLHIASRSERSPR